jgi:hypothetical protein
MLSIHINTKTQRRCHYDSGAGLHSSQQSTGRRVPIRRTLIGISNTQYFGFSKGFTNQLEESNRQTIIKATWHQYPANLRG